MWVLTAKTSNSVSGKVSNKEITKKGNNAMKNKKNFIKDPKSDALDGKVQVENQEQAGSMSTDVTPASSNEANGTIKELKEPKASINTKKAAEVVTEGSISDGGFGAPLLRSSAITFGGGAGTIAGDNSATTKEARPYRSGDRAGRQADSITRRVDALRPETFRTFIHQSKPLFDSEDGVGYNGNYFNEHVITNRRSGGVPGDELFERSIDEISLDMIYNAFGQFVTDSNGLTLNIHDYNVNDQEYATTATTFHLGTYLPTRLTVTVSANGITDFQTETENLSSINNDELTCRMASDAALRFFNLSELDRNVIISKAGNESDNSWTPLGDAIIDSSDQNAFLKLLDNIAGSYIYTSRRKLNTALSYQINKTAKDGLRIVGPIAEMCNGNVISNDLNTTYESVTEDDGYNNAFRNPEALRNGGAALYIYGHDSVAKYNTKGKMLSLPLSFKNALSVVDANCEPFRMDPQLHQLMEKHELFSTIDTPYDPLKPIVLTDKVGVTYPINPFVGTSFDDGNFNSHVYTMHFENLRNKYNISINNYFAQGIYDYIETVASRWFNAINTNTPQNQRQDEYEITIPIVSSTTTVSLWDLIVCMATPFMVKDRLTSLTPLLKYEKNFGYPYSGSEALKDVDPVKCDNFTFTSYDKELTTGVARPIPALKVIMPEVFWPVHKASGEAKYTGYTGKNGAVVYTVLPHYFNQNQFKFTEENLTNDTLFVLSEDYASVSYPSTRSGENLSFMDTIYGMSENDYRLSLDRMVVYPGYEGKKYVASKLARAPLSSNALPVYTYKYGAISDGIPVIPYFGYANDADNKQATLTVRDIMSTPRELGLMYVAPMGVLSAKYTSTGTHYVDLDDAYLSKSGPGFIARCYVGAPATGQAVEQFILQPGDKNIENNALYEYRWYGICATPSSAGQADYGFTLNAEVGSHVAFVPFTQGSYTPDYGNYDPHDATYADNEIQYNGNGFNIYSSMKYIWTRLQRLPFVVNPFDCNATEINNNNEADLNQNDIFEFLYYFGFCGFRASDYKVKVNSRSKQRIAQGMNYVEDPFVNESLLLK